MLVHVYADSLSAHADTMYINARPPCICTSHSVMDPPHGSCFPTLTLASLGAAMCCNARLGDVPKKRHNLTKPVGDRGILVPLPPTKVEFNTCTFKLVARERLLSSVHLLVCGTVSMRHKS